MKSEPSTHEDLRPGPISGREWRFVWAVIVGVLVVTSLPYLYGYLSSPPDRQFMGLLLDVPDHGQYLSWWRSFQSAPLVSNKLTPEPNEPVFFNLLWWTLAQVSRFTGLGYAPVYQAFRWAAGALFLWAAYRLVAQLVAGVGRRRLAFLLIAFSSGFGWVLVVLKYTLTKGELLFPLDVFIAEGNSFLCLLGYPHFIQALALILLTLEFVWRGWTENRMRHTVVAGLLALVLGWTHTYDLLIVYGVTGLFGVLVWIKERRFPTRLFWGGVVMVALSCSGAIYSVILTTIDPLWEEVLAQFANAGVYTPTPPHLVILFGLPLVLAVATWIALVVKKDWRDETLFVLGWFAAGAALNYIPTDFQVHMLNSWQVPMMILVTLGVCDLVVPFIGRRWPAARAHVARWATVALLVAVVPTNLYLWAWRFVDLARHDYPYYLYRDDVAAMEWLSAHAAPDQIVLSSETIGQYVPALSGNTAFLAHWAQTVRYYDKGQRVALTYDAATPDSRRAENIAAFGVDYLYHGPAERALGAYDPATTPWLSTVFSSTNVDLYAVLPAQMPAATTSGDVP